jgi:hypothetical protein
MVLIINNITFKNKTECTIYIKKLLYKEFLDDNEKKFVYELLKLHPYYNEIINDAITNDGSCIIVKNYIGNTRCFNILKNNSNIQPFSYSKCLDGKINLKNEILTAMRNSIRPDIYIYRNNIFNTSDDISCELCNIKIINNSNTHIDHVIKFKDLVFNFCIEEDIYILNIPIKTTTNKLLLVDNNIDGFNEIIIDDPIILNKWILYHKMNAILRPLCKFCNMKLH